MDIVKYIRLCCVQKDKSLRQVASDAKITPQNLSNKMTRDKFYTSDIDKIANALNADVKISFIDRDTKEPII